MGFEEIRRESNAAVCGDRDPFYYARMRIRYTFKMHIHRWLHGIMLESTNMGIPIKGDPPLQPWQLSSTAELATVTADMVLPSLEGISLLHEAIQRRRAS